MDGLSNYQLLVLVLVGQHLVNASQKVTLGHVRANSLTIIEFINHNEEIELKDI